LAHTAPAAPAPPVATPSRPPGDVFLVFSGKGGVGRSVLATNLAVTLARDTGARVALVDLDLQFGDVGVMLNLDHSRSITDLIDSAEQLAPETLEEVLAEGPAGVKVLLAPISPELADLVTPGHVRAIMAELRRSFDYVVVDTSTHLAEFNLEVIEMASKVLVVTSLTIAAIKDAKLTLKVLESLNVDPESILLVINRVDAFLEFNRESIERNLNCPVAAEIAHDPRLVGDSVTHGFPFVERQPEAEVSEAVRQLAVRLVPSKALAGVGAGGDQGKKRQRRGIFGR
ncbi:MAG TPA: P-loop NTPase, partial [Candidatus Sulfotelmatobacter sp.]|nr:P-loop NTPase [Candidatus Sulfotelmatobacter sp.]